MKDNISEKLIELIKVHERQELADKLGIGYNWLSQIASEIKKTGTVILDPEGQKQIIRTIDLLYFKEFESAESKLSPAEVDNLRAVARDSGVNLEQLAAECLRRFGDVVALVIKSKTVSLGQRAGVGPNESGRTASPGPSPAHPPDQPTGEELRRTHVSVEEELKKGVRQARGPK